MRLLVTGASGFIGGRLLEALSGAHEARGTARSGGALERLELDGPGAEAALLDAFRPDAVVHCAAMASPDDCEKDAERAFRVNALAPGRLAAACAARGVRLVHLSTDLVFDGKRAPYAEGDAAEPLSVYGRSKLEGEKAVLAADPGAAVVRVSLVYGRARGGRQSFLDWLIGELSAGRRPRLFTDQWRTPTAVSQLPGVVERLCRDRALNGVFHWGGAERVSRLEFGRAVCRVFGLSEALLQPIRMAELGLSAARPADCSLDSGRLARALGAAPLGLEAGLSAER